jgi:hypothetical protein
MDQPPDSIGEQYIHLARINDCRDLAFAEGWMQ